MTVEEIIKECLKRKIYVSDVCLAENGNLAYSINGFSKSGTAEIYQDVNIVVCKTRYDTIDYIDNFENLALIAFQWNKNYADTYGWDSSWLPIFEEYGWVKIIKEQKTIIQAN